RHAVPAALPCRCLKMAMARYVASDMNYVIFSWELPTCSAVLSCFLIRRDPRAVGHYRQHGI
ncbi:unnamed protein product, partial [Phaeothamnion confervicola]